MFLTIMLDFKFMMTTLLDYISQCVIEIVHYSITSFTTTPFCLTSTFQKGDDHNHDSNCIHNRRVRIAKSQFMIDEFQPTSCFTHRLVTWVQLVWLKIAKLQSPDRKVFVFIGGTTFLEQRINLIC